MATATKTIGKKKVVKKKAAKKAAPKKKPAKKTAIKKNKLGVKNSLVNNINKRKEKGISRPKKRSSISKKEYDDMEAGWDSAKTKKKKK